MVFGSMSLREIVINQSGYWWYVIPKWYIFLQPLGFIIYVIAGVALVVLMISIFWSKREGEAMDADLPTADDMAKVASSGVGASV